MFNQFGNPVKLFVIDIYGTSWQDIFVDVAPLPRAWTKKAIAGKLPPPSKEGSCDAVSTCQDMHIEIKIRHLRVASTPVENGILADLEMG